MERAEEAALKAYPNVEQPVWDESYPKTLFVRHTERNAFIKGYEQAENDTIEKATNWCLTYMANYFGYSMVYPELFVKDFRKAMKE